MSRIGVPNEQGDEVIVGWDNPMRTYFAQVRVEGEPLAEDESYHDRTGQEFGQHEKLRSLERWLEVRGYSLDDRVRAQLHADKLNSGPRAPLQQKVEFIMTGKIPPDEEVAP